LQINCEDKSKKQEEIMTSKTIKIRLEHGLEARPVALLVQEASKYDSSIYIVSGGKRVNAKSIMGMMTLGLANGEELTVTTEGTDEQEALNGLDRFLSNVG
jgi:catabolite repression HPr-like protein